MKGFHLSCLQLPCDLKTNKQKETSSNLWVSLSGIEFDCKISLFHYVKLQQKAFPIDLERLHSVLTKAGSDRSKLPLKTPGDEEEIEETWMLS